MLEFPQSNIPAIPRPFSFASQEQRDLSQQKTDNRGITR